MYMDKYFYNDRRVGRFVVQRYDPYKQRCAETFKKHIKMLRRWKFVRDAVRVRPFALHWLEQYAMAKERARLEFIDNAPATYDSLECGI